MLKLLETLFVQLLRRTPVLGFCKHCLLGTPFSLWPHAIGTQVCQNGDPISSEMGIKWGPCAAEGEPKKQIFAKLIKKADLRIVTLPDKSKICPNSRAAIYFVSTMLSRDSISIKSGPFLMPRFFSKILRAMLGNIRSSSIFQFM